jgi:hypothetical protein
MSNLSAIASDDLEGGGQLLCRRRHQALVACLAFGSRLQNTFSQNGLYCRDRLFQCNFLPLRVRPHGLDKLWTNVCMMTVRRRGHESTW